MTMSRGKYAICLLALVLALALMGSGWVRFLTAVAKPTA
jgi:hypothetical protein